MNNVDDGIEIWGGTVGLKYITIWNIGDDSFDVDQGWRGKAQFGLIVQGYSRNASQGSGLGDNIFEFDGAENSDAQPHSATIYNFTTVANTESGDGTTTWRDNASVQYRNCIFIGKGDKLVRADGEDGDGSSGYGHNGTLSLEERFETNARTPEGLPYVDPVNSTGDDAFMASLYQSQTDGKLAEITDCVISGFGSITNDPYYDLVPNSMRGTNFETPALPIKALVRSR